MSRGDIYFIELPPPPGGSGREQTGYRPVIVVSSNRFVNENPMVMVVPLTSKLSALRFPYSVKIEPSPENGLSSTSVAMVFQLLAIDKRRLRSQSAGRLEEKYLDHVVQELRALLDL